LGRLSGWCGGFGFSLGSGMEAASKKIILRIELWHFTVLLTMSAMLVRAKAVDLTSFVVGGVFMAVNFLLLSFGIAWLLTPMASRGRIKAGVGLLVLKITIFLALLTAIFLNFKLDPLSFALGFSSLIVAILIESFRHGLGLAK
jgi:hypothetical protein